MNTQFSYIRFNKRIYSFFPDEQLFDQYPPLLSEFKKDQEITRLYQRGLSEEEVLHIRKMIGKNLIEVKIPNPFKILFDEIVSPFYFYQGFCIAVWILDEYQYYAYAVVILSFISIVSTLVEKILSAYHIKKLAHQDIPVTVRRRGNNK